MGQGSQFVYKVHIHLDQIVFNFLQACLMAVISPCAVGSLLTVNSI